MPPSMPFPTGLKIIDSHTEGEPTRVVIDGFPELLGETLVDKRADFAARFDTLRTALICEPRGYDAMVGALLIWSGEPLKSEPTGVIFFNDAGFLGMCGHGTIGVAETLRFLGLAGEGSIDLSTPAGSVRADFEPDSRLITMRNVASYHYSSAVVKVQGENVQGDIAYGGNWFWLQEVPDELLDIANAEYLMGYTKRIRNELRLQGVAGKNGANIDHVELFATKPGGSKNFVLCPGNAYDRSPCGTGTSAKLACLAHHGTLAPGEVWRSESITGGVFLASYQVIDGDLIPSISGRAYITGRYEPIFDLG